MNAHNNNDNNWVILIWNLKISTFKVKVKVQLAAEDIKSNGSLDI